MNSNNQNLSQNKRRIIAMLLVLTIAILAIIFLIVTSKSKTREVIIGKQVFTNMPTTDTDLNVGQIVDAINNKNIVPKEGYRYRVKIDSLSRDGTSGVAHIGGMVTFVPNAKKGDIAVIQITSVRRTVANAKLISRKKGNFIENKKNNVDKNAIIDTIKNKKVDIIKNRIYRGIVKDIGKKGDGIVKVSGKVTFVPGVEKGDVCIFKIIDIRPKFNRAILINIEK